MRSVRKLLDTANVEKRLYAERVSKNVQSCRRVNLPHISTSYISQAETRSMLAYEALQIDCLRGFLGPPFPLNGISKPMSIHVELLPWRV